MPLLLLLLHYPTATVAVAITGSVADVAVRVRLSERTDTGARACIVGREAGGMMCIDGCRATTRKGLLRGTDMKLILQRVKAPSKGFISWQIGRVDGGESSGNANAVRRCQRSQRFALGLQLTFRCFRNPLTDISLAAAAAIYATRESPSRNTE